jgi:hypothetical protein
VTDRSTTEAVSQITIITQLLLCINAEFGRKQEFYTCRKAKTGAVSNI